MPRRNESEPTANTQPDDLMVVVRRQQLRRLTRSLGRGDVTDAVRAFRWAVCTVTRPGEQPRYRELDALLEDAEHEARVQQRTAPNVIDMFDWLRKSVREDERTGGR